MVSMDEVKNVVLKLNSASKNFSMYDAIPPSTLKETMQVHLKYLTNINHSLKESTFPDELKQSEVIPVYKKLDPLQKKNYRPMSLLPHISRVFERVIYKQLIMLWKTKSQNMSRVSGNHMAHNIL